MVYDKVNWENGQIVNDGYVVIDGQQYPVVMPEYSGSTPVNADNLDHMDDGIKELCDSTFYKSGDSYVLSSSQLYVGGALTGSSKSVSFTIFLPKRLDNITSVEASNLNVAVRHTGGGYWANGDISSSNITVAAVGENFVSISISSSTASGTNNTPCNVYIRSLTLTFS